MGAGIELERRLQIVEVSFTRSNNTTVHLKDSSSGPQGFLSFVKAVISGLMKEQGNTEELVNSS